MVAVEVWQGTLAADGHGYRPVGNAGRGSQQRRRQQEEDEEGRRRGSPHMWGFGVDVWFPPLEGGARGW